jgi:hypothetical protein
MKLKAVPQLPEPITAILDIVFPLSEPVFFSFDQAFYVAPVHINAK